jgi:hypothetical protein
MGCPEQVWVYSEANWRQEMKKQVEESTMDRIKVAEEEE